MVGRNFTTNPRRCQELFWVYTFSTYFFHEMPTFPTSYLHIFVVSCQGAQNFVEKPWKSYGDFVKTLDKTQFLCISNICSNWPHSAENSAPPYTASIPRTGGYTPSRQKILNPAIRFYLTDLKLYGIIILNIYFLKIFLQKKERRIRDAPRERRVACATTCWEVVRGLPQKEGIPLSLRLTLLA